MKQVEVVHISQQRFDFILSLGYKLRVGDGRKDDVPVSGSILFHVLPSECSICPICGGDEAIHSADVNSPAELEVWKHAETEAMYADAVKYMRQADILIAKNYWESKQV